MWCDFGANLVEHFIKRYSRYSRYQTVLSKLEEIISTEGRNLQKTFSLCWTFFVISWRTMNCPCGHELADAMNCTTVHESPAALEKQGNSIHEIEDFKS